LNAQNLERHLQQVHGEGARAVTENAATLVLSTSVGIFLALIGVVVARRAGKRGERQL
jgi:hypothetical protein